MNGPHLARKSQTDGQQPECPEQGRVCVVESEKCPVLVIVHQGCVQCAAAEHASAHEIPERRADDVVVREPVLELLLRADQPIVIDRLDDERPSAPGSPRR